MVVDNDLHRGTSILIHDDFMAFIAHFFVRRTRESASGGGERRSNPVATTWQLRNGERGASMPSSIRNPSLIICREMGEIE